MFAWVHGVHQSVWMVTKKCIITVTSQWLFLGGLIDRSQAVWTLRRPLWNNHQAVFVTTLIHGLMWSVPYPNFTFSTTQLEPWPFRPCHPWSNSNSRTQVRSFVNKGTRVDLLLPYPMEAKESWTDLLDMLPPALNMHLIGTCVTWLLAQRILAINLVVTIINDP